jgi:hypothetical protein
VTTVRIVFALQSLRAARAPDGSDVPDWRLHQRLVVLADTAPAKDGGHRAVPLWLRVYGHKELLNRVARLGRPGRPPQTPRWPVACWRRRSGCCGRPGRR